MKCWWSAHAAEAEKRAWAAEQCGHGGSLIRDLWLLRKSASKPSTSTLLARNGSNLTGDGDKLQCWVEHFSDFVNCESEVRVATLNALPVLEPPSALSDDVCMNELSDNLTEEEIVAAISQMRKGRAPGLDGISIEILKLGGTESVHWLKTIADGIWRTEVVPSEWTKQRLIPIHKKGSHTTCDNYRGITLLSIPSKIFSRAILNWLQPCTDLFLRQNQCDFHQG